jgi:two-component system chemotaxis response regulator CheB
MPWLIVIAASAGGLKALQALLASIPRDLAASLVIVQHRSPTLPSYLLGLLAKMTQLPVLDARDGERIEAGRVYLARSDLHLTVSPKGRFQHVDGTRIRGLLSSANPLLESAARVFGDRTIGVVLTGSGMDATNGVQTVKAHGGCVIAQDPATAQFGGMPRSAIKTGAVDYVLPIEAIGPMLAAIVRGEQAAAAIPTR